MNLDHRFITFRFYNRAYVTIIFPSLLFMKYRQEICVPDIVADMENHKNIKLNVLNLYRVLRKRRRRPTTLPLCVEELEPFPIPDVTLSVRSLRVKRFNSFDSFRRSYPFVSRRVFSRPGAVPISV